jgi:F-type H+-transporting ATPase subunit alpha
MHELDGFADDLFDRLDRLAAGLAPALEIADTAHVLSVGEGVARVAGFTDLRADELVTFEDGTPGIAASLRTDRTGVMLLGPAGGLRPGQKVWRTGRVADVPVGDALLGRVVDALGRPLDGGPTPRTGERLPVERPAPPIMARAPVRVPLQTGIKAVDAAIPVGRGQRELILGDRQTGKTAIALEAILNQPAGGPVSVYCAVGQRASAVARVIATLRAAGALERTVVVVAGGNDAPGLQFLAPYAATSIAEHFMAEGRDALIVYDDLTRHARAYRELSLLLRRPPGREAYPGDIFHIHARLLERATQLRAEAGGGSLTALPVIETQAQNLSAYIPTNLISITDGQIYLSPELFEKGQLPAVDIGASVSRVGGKAQLPAYRAVAGDLRLLYSQFEELETFARFGTQLDEATRRRLDRGLRLREVLKQDEGRRLPVPEQIAELLAATEGLFDALPPEAVAGAATRAHRAARDRCPEICHSIEDGAPLGADARAALIAAMRAAMGEAGDGDA